MKKLAIASASLALAAMPVVGVFATADDGSFTDNITVNVAGGCTLGQASSGSTTPTDRTFVNSITNGTAVTLTGSGGSSVPTLEVLCNTESATAFHITANPANGGSLVSENDDEIESGVAESGNTSAFMYKLSGDTWSPVPTTATKIVSETASSTTPYTFNPSYRVFVSLDQPAGSYEGSITYTLAMGA